MTKKCKHVDNSCREEKLGCTNCAYDKGMTIQTKYSIGEKIWVADENVEHKQVDVYSDIITGVFVDNKNKVLYLLEGLLDDVQEDKIIPYYDLTRLATTIVKIDKNFKEEVEK